MNFKEIKLKKKKRSFTIILEQCSLGLWSWIASLTSPYALLVYGVFL